MSVTTAPRVTPYLEAELIENLQNRLNRIEGHVRGVNRMLEDRESCDDILVQLSAIKAAVNQVTIKLLDGHMNICLVDYAATDDVEALEHFKRSMALVMKNS
ncbi:MAG: metal-sensitive transcriptional regulator [Anaerolineales bacterium]